MAVPLYKSIKLSLVISLNVGDFLTKLKVPFESKKEIVKEVRLETTETIKKRVNALARFVLEKHVLKVEGISIQNSESEDCVITLITKQAVLEVLAEKGEAWQNLHFWNASSYKDIHEDIVRKLIELTKKYTNEEKINSESAICASPDVKIEIEEKIKSLEKEIIDNNKAKNEVEENIKIDAEDLLNSFFVFRAYDLLDLLLENEWISLISSCQYQHYIVNKTDRLTLAREDPPSLYLEDQKEPENVMRMMEVLCKHKLSNPCLPITKNDHPYKDRVGGDVSFPPIVFSARECDDPPTLFPRYERYGDERQSLPCKKAIQGATQGITPEHIADEITAYVRLDPNDTDDTNKTALNYTFSSPDNARGERFLGFGATLTPTRRTRCYEDLPSLFTSVIQESYLIRFMLMDAFLSIVCYLLKEINVKRKEIFTRKKRSKSSKLNMKDSGSDQLNTLLCGYIEDVVVGCTLDNLLSDNSLDVVKTINENSGTNIASRDIGMSDRIFYKEFVFTSVEDIDRFLPPYFSPRSFQK